MSAETPAAEARILRGKYRLERQIGAGAFGAVWAARQLGLDKPVAVKLLTPEAFKTPGAVERFEREALLASKISHPVMAQVLDFGVDEGAPFIVMEMIEGDELGQVIEKHGPLAPARAIAVMRQLASLLGEVHARGIVHRDLKPANLKLLRYTPQARQVHVKVLDFGIAKDVAEGAQQQLTATGSFLGTPRYMSPEQVKGQNVDARSDLYSCGVILYELLTGEAPIRAASVAELIARLLYEPVPELPARFPPGLRAMVARLLEKDAALRYPDAHTFDVALEACESECREAGMGETHTSGPMALEATMPSGNIPAALRSGAGVGVASAPSGSRVSAAISGAGVSASGAGRVQTGISGSGVAAALIGNASTISGGQAAMVPPVSAGQPAAAPPVSAGQPAVVPAVSAGQAVVQPPPNNRRVILIVATVLAAAAAAAAVGIVMQARRDNSGSGPAQPAVTPPVAAGASDAALAVADPVADPIADPIADPVPVPQAPPDAGAAKRPPGGTGSGGNPGKVTGLTSLDVCEDELALARSALASVQLKRAVVKATPLLKDPMCAPLRARVRAVLCMARCQSPKGLDDGTRKCMRALLSDRASPGLVAEVQQACKATP